MQSFLQRRRFADPSSGYSDLAQKSSAPAPRPAAAADQEPAAAAPHQPKPADRDGDTESKAKVDDEKTDGQPEKPGSSGGDGKTSGDGKESGDDDKIVVQLTGEHDPVDPKNWSLGARRINMTVLSLLVFTQAWAGAANSPANTPASLEFGVSKRAENAATAAYLFGIGSGALFSGPLSETVGRNPTFLVATPLYLLFVLGSALVPNFGGQVACRFFVGLFASPTLSINGSSVGDQFRAVKRSFVFPVIAWANVAAPVIAPIAGGWIVNNPNLSWRWTEWVTLIISGFAFIVAVLFLPESYLPLLLDWKARHLRHATGDDRYTSEFAQKETFLKRMRKILPMPATFLATEPVVGVLGVYLVLLYTLLFSSLSGFDYIFKETYKLSSGQTGACFGAVAAGATTFTLGAPGLYTWARHRTEHIRGRDLEPEFRLWPAIVTAPLLPVALFWLGYTATPTTSIWVPLGASFLFGICLIAIYVSCYEYIIDSYQERAAIALASITMVRYLVAGGMVMAARPMYEGIGVKYTMTLLGSIAIILAPAPAVFWWFGKKLRAKSPYAATDDDLKM